MHRARFRPAAYIHHRVKRTLKLTISSDPVPAPAQETTI
jgi:hypothetical protein